MCVTSGSERVPLKFIGGIPAANKLKLRIPCNYHWAHWT